MINHYQCFDCAYCRGRYGFPVPDALIDEYLGNAEVLIPSLQYRYSTQPVWQRCGPAAEKRQAKRWASMQNAALASSWERAVENSNTRKLKKLIWGHGIPRHLRRSMWMVLSGADKRAAAQPGLYPKLQSR